MSKAREEQQRNSRRLARQMLGVVAMALIVIGLFTVVGWVARAVRAVFDDSEDRLAYEQKLYGLVMFDTLPFENAAEVDPAVFQQAAIWSVLYQIQCRDGNFDGYERDEMTGSIILPELEVDTYLKNLLGPDYEVEPGPFETTDFIYNYSDERQGYLVPVTGMAGLYTPQVEGISHRGGKTYVTVGYVPTAFNSTEMLFSVPTEPTKYMEYVFERGKNRQWYLTALEESERQPDATPAPTAAADAAADLAGLPEGIQDPMAGQAAPGADLTTEPVPADGSEPVTEPVPVEGEGAAEAPEGEEADDGETAQAPEGEDAGTDQPQE